MLGHYGLLSGACLALVLSGKVSEGSRVGGNSFNQGPGRSLEKSIRHSSLHHYVLVKELDLILEVTANDILQEADVS